jgi:hypothetical protein
MSKQKQPRRLADTDVGMFGDLSPSRSAPIALVVSSALCGHAASRQAHADTRRSCGAREQVGRAGPFGDCDLHDDAGLFNRQHRPPVYRTRLWRTAIGQYRVGPDRLSRRHRGRLAHLGTTGRHAGTQAALPGRSHGLYTQLDALRGRALIGHAHRRALSPTNQSDENEFI